MTQSREESCPTPWWTLSDADLLAQCEADHYRASGPGGQKRNKTDSAVRLRHLPTGLIVTATESRRRLENQLRAVRRLREALCYRLRRPVDSAHASEAVTLLFDVKRSLSPRDPNFLEAMALLLDLLEADQGRIGDVAKRLDRTTAAVARALESTDESWQAAQEIRAKHGLPALKR